MPLSSQGPKQALLAELAGLARALGHPHRLELLEHVAQRERGVEALAHRVGMSVANASQHLQHLRRANLVTSRRDGKYVLYRLADDGLLTVLTALRRVAERNVAAVGHVVRSYFDDRDSLEPVSREELLVRSRDGLVTILDVRPGDEFAAGHIPGAISMPIGELEARLRELDPEHQIVAYCRSAYCIFSFEAVAALRSRGYAARRLEDGFPEWRAAGLAVSAG